MQHIDFALIEKSLGYDEYHAHIEQILSQNHYLALQRIEHEIHETRLNLIRMERLDKTARMTAQTRLQMAAIRKPLIWLSLSEVWCGDAAQILPAIQKMAALSDKVQHRILFRDENPNLMDAFLTQGTRSIPLTIILDQETLRVLGHWGPRPVALQQYVLENLVRLGAIADETTYISQHNEFMTKVQRWYAKDKTYSTQKEFLEVLKKCL